MVDELVQILGGDQAEAHKLDADMSRAPHSGHPGAYAEGPPLYGEGQLKDMSKRDL
jgi:hypothetical protein